jgi:hypothetical protein
MRNPLALPVLLVGLAACRAVPVVPGGRSPNCPLEFFHKAPERHYDELGHLRVQVTTAPAGGPVEALRPGACALGADAVIVERTQVLNLFDHVMVEGTAIRFRPDEPAPPPAPTSPPTGDVP